MTKSYPHPSAFLTVRVETFQPEPTLTAWCAGYELNTWRTDQLARHLLQWLPEFALKYSEWQGLAAHNAVELIGKAARTVYKSPNYALRGEFGEILLHVMIRQHFKSVPAISKFYFKDGPNETVKGFDAVHVVQNGTTWELWLGEVKFYAEIGQAISAVIRELEVHMKRDYLRGEFLAITNKIDEAWEGADSLKSLLSNNVSLDKIFKKVCIPILLTYNSETISRYRSETEEFEADFRAEVLAHLAKFTASKLPSNVSVKLFLFPLEDKAELVKKMDEVLKNCQAAF